jgi:dephospho-CoA kinase
MKIIGLTGQSGAGKGTVASLFAEHGIPSIDTDAVYHELLIPPSACLDELVNEFTDAILATDGTLDRAAMASLVFADTLDAKERLALLNRITHRHVTERTLALLDEFRAAGKSAALIDAPLLIEAGLHKGCDVVVAVLADREVRLARLIARDNKDRAAILARMDAQPSDEFYISHADIVVQNNGDEQALAAESVRILRHVGVLA